MSFLTVLYKKNSAWQSKSLNNGLFPQLNSSEIYIYIIVKWKCILWTNLKKEILCFSELKIQPEFKILLDQKNGHGQGSSAFSLKNHSNKNFCCDLWYIFY